MKNVLYILFLALMAQSCSHVVVYQELHYSCTDSPYPIEDMKFAYYAGDKNLSSSLRAVGDRICMKAQKDSAYDSCLASTDEFEMLNDTFMVARQYFMETIENSKVTLASIKSSSIHRQAIRDGRSQLSALSACKVSYFKEYWKRVYQLSHRGILQHYMTADEKYSRLSEKKQMLLYGYILNMDIAKCYELADIATNREKSTIADLRTEITTEVARHKKIQDEIEAREREIEEERREEEYQRQEKERLERLRKEEAERKKREAEQAQAAAQHRWVNDSWMDGHWATHIAVKKGYNTLMASMDLYIDTDNKTIKLTTQVLAGDTPQVHYYGSYRIYNNAGSRYGSRWNGYKVIEFGVYHVFADPDEARLKDENGYFMRPFWP